MSTSLTSQPTRQFGRALRLELSNSKGGAGVLITNLRVTFDIEKKNDKHPNKATITIYNLTESNRHKLAAKEWDYARLLVGYGLTQASFRLIYEGNITRTNDQRPGLDIQTVLECGDARFAYVNGYVSTTLAKGATHEDVINECLDSMPGVDEGYIVVDNNQKFSRAKTIHGQAHRVLDNTAKACNASWSIQDNKLYFIPHASATDELIPLISATSGMIGPPKATDKGLEVTCNLNPALAIGGLVAVESMFTQYNGQYKIDTVRFRGDNDPRGPWQSDIAVLGGDFAKKPRRKKGRKKKGITTIKAEGS